MSKEQKKTKRSATEDVVSRDYTIHLHKLVHGKSFKKRAPSAIKVIRQFAVKAMGTADVRLDPSLNRAVWNQGIKNVPRRIRVRLSRNRNVEEDAKEKLYTIVYPIEVPSFKGLTTVTVAE
jgi:large subunit ribosomal protein L31e